MAYSRITTITIDSTKVSGSSDHSSFAVLISGTYAGSGSDPDLRTTANGGNIQNTASGGVSGSLTIPADLIFTSDSGGTTQLDHEFEYYNSSTGQIVAWVRIPALLYSSDTVIYMPHSDSSVTVSQENIASVWNANYTAVYHSSEASGVLLDSTSGGDDLTDINTVTSGTGKVYNGRDYEVTANEGFGPLGSVRLPGNMTVQAWLKPESIPSGVQYYINDDWAGSGRNFLFNLNGNVFNYKCGNGSTLQDATLVSTTTVSAGSWYFVAGKRTGTSQKLYVNTATEASQTGSYSGGTTTNNRHIGGNVVMTSGYTWDGIIDEFRLSNIERSDDWLLTEYNNQNSPSTFYSVSDAAFGGGATRRYFAPGIWRAV